MSYSIKDLERLSGIKAHTIRIWEKRYGLIEPSRTATNIRSYCETELKKLLNISILNRSGLKISKIAELKPQEISSLVDKLTENSKSKNSQLENLYIAMIDMDEVVFEKILSRTIIKMGFEDMVINLLYPFFDHMGIMWQTGTITPVQEHFISNIVRQKIIVAIDSIVTNETQKSKTFILFLPEEEMHELGLLFMNYILRKRGHRVIYLGSALPTDSLMQTTQIKPAEYLVTSLVCPMEQKKLNNYIQDLSKNFSDKNILVTGQQAKTITDAPNNIQLIPVIKDFIKTIDNIQ